MPRTHIAIIGAPLDLGQDRRGVDMGPSAVRVANLHARVASLGYEVEDWGNIPVEQKEAWPEGDPHAKYLALIASACDALASAGGRSPLRRTPAARPGRRSFRRGGHASAAFPATSARAAKRSALIWLDAHADMNTPESSPSGNIHGMPLACILGIGPAELVDLLGYHPKVDPRNAVIVGLRDVDATEKPQVRDSGIRAFTMRDIDERGLRTVMEEAIRIATEGTAGLHLSLDMDFCDPGGRPRSRHPGPRRRDLPRSAFGNGNDLRFAAHGLDGSGGGEPRDRREESHRRFGCRTDHVRIGKTHLMKIRVAVIYGGRTGEHEVSVRSAKAILAGLDPEKYEKIEYFIDQQGKWSPRPILPEPGAHPGHRRGLPRPARHLRRGRHHAGSARTGRPALRRRGRDGVRRLHG